jgi:hypothetical protein
MQYRRFIAAVLVPATLLLFTGCTKTVWVGPAELQPKEKVKGVVTADGQRVELDPFTATLRGDTIYADKGEDAPRFALDEVSRVGVLRFDYVSSGAILLSVALVAVVVVAAATYEPIGPILGMWDLPY